MSQDKNTLTNIMAAFPHRTDKLLSAIQTENNVDIHSHLTIVTSARVPQKPFTKINFSVGPAGLICSKCPVSSHYNASPLRINAILLNAIQNTNQRNNLIPTDNLSG